MFYKSNVFLLSMNVQYRTAYFHIYSASLSLHPFCEYNGKHPCSVDPLSPRHGVSGRG